MNRKFFQLRSMTKNLDEIYSEDYELYRTFSLQSFPTPNSERMEYDRNLLQEWEEYKRKNDYYNLKSIIDKCMNNQNSAYLICICDFLKGRKISIEIYLKIAYDIFNDNDEGRQFRQKFWNSLRKRSNKLQQDLQFKRCPQDWKYVEFSKEKCLNFDMIKLFEQYIPTKILLAQFINTQTSTMIDLRRMPLLFEDKQIFITPNPDSWFPKMQICKPELLSKLYYSQNIYCEAMLKFMVDLKDIVLPVLDLFCLSTKCGRVFNLYGKEYDFILEALYSLKVICGTPIRATQGSLKIKKSYKSANSLKSNEDDCKIILTTFTQTDMNSEVNQDIYENLHDGYSAFGSTMLSPYLEKKKRLVIILSDEKLIFKQDGVIYQQLQDFKINRLKKTYDYPFLVYYSNLLFNKAMTVQQNCSSRKPFYQLYLCVWTYIMPLYFQNTPSNCGVQKDKIYGLISEMKSKKPIQIEDNLIIELDNYVDTIESEIKSDQIDDFNYIDSSEIIMVEDHEMIEII